MSAGNNKTAGNTYKHALHACVCVCGRDSTSDKNAWHYVMCKASSTCARVCVCVPRSLIRHHGVVNVLSDTSATTTTTTTTSIMGYDSFKQKKQRKKKNGDDDDDDYCWLRLNQTCWIWLHKKLFAKLFQLLKLQVTYQGHFI